MRRKYAFWVCPQCEDAYDMAGFCPVCNVRCNRTIMIPAKGIVEKASESQFLPGDDRFEEFLIGVLGYNPFLNG